ncbi:hypothetical protein FXW27_00270 [Candidatus Liberibacter asiaticus]|nr:hypothetical protein FXW27_00270 [Candidatus Liberibacter asiaticus]
MLTTLSIYSSPSIRSYIPGLYLDPIIMRAAALYKVDIRKVDFPPPDIPVIAVNNPRGIDPVTFFKLLLRALIT